MSAVAAVLNEPVTEVDTVGPTTDSAVPVTAAAADNAPTAGLLALAGLPLLGRGATPAGIPPTNWALLWWLRRNQDSSLLDEPQTAALGTVAPTAVAEQLAATDDASTDQAPILVITPTSTDPTTGAVTYHVDIADPDSPDLPTVTLTELRHGSITDNGDGTVIYTPTAQARYAAGAENATDADKFENITITATGINGATTTVRVDVPITPSDTADRAPILVITPTSTDPATGAVDYHVDIADPDSPDLPTVTLTELQHGTITDNGDGTVTYTPTPAARYAAGAENATDADTFENITITATGTSGATTTVRVEVPITPANTMTGSEILPFGLQTKQTYTPDGRYLYLTNYTNNYTNDSDLHVSSTHVAIIDTVTGTATPIADVNGEVEDLLIAPNSNRAYLTTSVFDYPTATYSTNFAVIDTKTGATTVIATLQGEPENLLLSPDGEHIYVTYTVAYTVATPRMTYLSEINPDTGAVNALASIPGFAHNFEFTIPEYRPDIQFTPDSSHLYIVSHNLSGPDLRSDGSYLSFVDLASGATTTTAVRGRPTGLSLTPDGSHAYFQTDSYMGPTRVVLFDAATGAFTTFEKPNGTLTLAADGAHAYLTSVTKDAATGAYTTEITIIDTATGSASILTTVSGNGYLTRSPEGSQVYLTTFVPGASGGTGTTQFATVDPVTGTVSTIATNPGSETLRATLSADGSHAFVRTSDYDSTSSHSYLTVADLDDGTTTTTTIPGTPQDFVVAPDGSHAYLTTNGGANAGYLAIVDTATNTTTVTTLPGAATTGSIWTSADGSRTYLYTIDNSGDSTNPAYVIHLFAVDSATGGMSEIFSQPVLTNVYSTSFRFAPDGSSAYLEAYSVAGENSFSLTACRK